MMFPANQQSAIVSHPGKGALNFEALLVSLAVGNDGPAPLFATAARWNTRFDVVLSQALSKGTAVISAIRQQLTRTGFELTVAASPRTLCSVCSASGVDLLPNVIPLNSRVSVPVAAPKCRAVIG